jgi:16S rRNA G527 N7-methylase RsmG
MLSERQARVIEELQKKVEFLETVIQEMEIRWNKWQ